MAPEDGQTRLPGNEMAKAMKLGVEAGRYGYLAGCMKKKTYASSSSPVNQISKSKFL